MVPKMGVFGLQKLLIILAVAVMAGVIWLSYRGPSNANPEATKSVTYPQQDSVQGVHQNPLLSKPSNWVPDSHASRWMSSIRNILQYEPWPEKQNRYNRPGKMYPVIHFVWCGEKMFRFHDYLSILSAIRMMQPLKLVIHYTHMPLTDSYNTWFQELMTTFGGLELLQFSSEFTCGSRDMAKTALNFLSQEGGLLLFESVIISRIPEDFTKPQKIWGTFFDHSGNKTLGFVYIHEGFNKSSANSNLDKLISDQRSQISSCVSVNTYNNFSNNVYCIFITETMHPRDIIETQTPYGELARWIFYGRRSVALPIQDPNNLIPRITHYIRLKSGSALYKEFPFSHFLSVLSALYVAGFEHVYVHAEEKPVGQWWEALAEENVTLVRVSRHKFIFGKRVEVVQHASDILRYMLVHKYGGAYQDGDVLWTSLVPNSLLAFPTVVGMEWEEKDSEWPESFNLGVFLARPRADWLERFIDTHKDFRDSDWGYNSLRMSYKTYELYPHLMFLDRRLQVICCSNLCHPAWEKGYVRRINDGRPTIPFKWQDVRSIHVTCPKPQPSLASVEALKNGKDVFAEIGRYILKKSGRQNLLS